MVLRAAVVVLVALAAAPPTARAGDNDLVLSRLGLVVTDAEGTPVGVVGQNLEFRALVSELGVILAPRLLAPADTLGFGGFQFAADVGVAGYSADASWWRALQSSPDPRPMADVAHGSGTMTTLGLFARKGMWFPVPSSEIGAGFLHVMDSELWAAQAYAKVALHEGYHDLPVPSLAVRGGVSRLIGTRELDLTVASVDVSVSKLFGVAGTWGLSPYGGWNALIVVPRSEVLDATPGVSSLDDRDDANLNFVFKDQDNVLRHRIFVGAKLQYYVFQLTVEAAFALAGSSMDDRGGTSEPCTLMSITTACDSTDLARAQRTISVSLGLDF
jgi:hypothetical protein